MKRVFCGWMLVCVLMCMAFLASSEENADAWTVEMLRTDGAADSYVICPVFANPAQMETAALVNETVQAQSRIQEYLTLLGQIEEGSTGLKMDCAVTQTDGHIVSLVFSAEGKMLTGRPSQVYYPMVLDLETGALVHAEQIFANVDAARMFLEEYLENEVAPLLSTHLESNELLPLPMDRFALDENGVTFYYEVKQLSFLSGYAGAVTVSYHEMREHLNLSEGSVLMRMGIAQNMLNITEKTAENIAAASASGHLGALPAQVGMLLEDALDQFRSTTDAGFYPGGAYYEMEAPALRDVLLITDAEETTVTGIYARRLSLWGLITGESTREDWHQVLGEPAFSMEMGESDGSAYLLCAGVSDYYDFGEYKLLLHADANGVLYAAVLSN